MLTMVPPSILPFSGAKTSGRFAPPGRGGMGPWLDGRGLTEVGEAAAGEDLLVDPEDVPPLVAVPPAGAGQVPHVGRLAVGLVVVGLRPVAGVEAHEGGGAALALARVPPRLRVGRPPHPLVVEDGVGAHLVRGDHSLEGVRLEEEEEQEEEEEEEEKEQYERQEEDEEGQEEEEKEEG